MPAWFRHPALAALALVLVSGAAYAQPVAVQQIDNPYGLDALWTQGDFVARGTLIALVLMSAGTWYTLVAKLVEQWRLLREASRVRKLFWKSATFQDGLALLPDHSAFRFVAASGIEAAQHHAGTLGDNIDLNSWVAQSVSRGIDQVVHRLQGGLVLLATVASTAPFVGLFGTVWGIFHALTAIGIAGQASIDKVAGPVGEALIMTAIGLLVAVPAVIGYNTLVRRNKQVIEHLRSFGSDIHSVLLGAPHLGTIAAKAHPAAPIAKVA